MKFITQSILVALVIISMVIAVKYSLHSSNVTDTYTKEVVRLKTSKDCNILQSECLFIIDKKQIRVRLLGNVRTMQPFNLVVQVDNFNSDIDTISVTFSMKSMMMGFNKFKLTKTQISNSSTEAGSDVDQWLASILLPVCVSKRSDWQMLVRVETPTKIFEVDIPIQIN